MLHAAFVRSPHAHAVVRRLDPKAAQAVDGVVAVVGPADLRAQPLAPQLAGDGFRPTAWPALASEPRFCGEAVAAVVAASAYAAADGAERVGVAYDVRPARVSLKQALRDDARQPPGDRS